MGFFSRFKSDDKKKSSPKSSAKTPPSDYSAAEGSEFSLTASQSSHSSQDTSNKRHSEIYSQKKPLPNPLINQRRYSQPRVYHERGHLNSSLQIHPIPYPPASNGSFVQNNLPSKQGPQNGPTQQLTFLDTPSPVNRNSVSPTYSHNTNSITNSTDFNRLSQDSPPSDESLLNQLPPLHVSHKPVSQQMPQQHMPQQQMPQNQSSHRSNHPVSFPAASHVPQLNPAASRTVPSSPMHPKPNHSMPSKISHSASTSMLSTFALPYNTVRETSGDYTATETSAETSAELSEDEDARKHPYYDQWKQYYAALAAQNHPQSQWPQQQQQQQYQPLQGPPAPNNYQQTAASQPPYGYSPRPSINPITNSARSSYMPHSRSTSSGLSNYQQSSAQNLAYLQYYSSLDAKKAENNGLVQNSRMSTLKLNRSSSSPSLAAPADPRLKSRAISVNVTGSEGQGGADTDQEAVEEEEEAEPMPSKLGAPSTKSMSFGLLAMAQAEKDKGPDDFRPPAPNQAGSSSISSLYSSTLGSSCTNDSTGAFSEGSQNNSSQQGVNNSGDSAAAEAALVREDSCISDYGKYLFNGNFDDSVDQDTSYDNTIGQDDIEGNVNGATQNAIGQEIADDLHIPSGSDEAISPGTAPGQSHHLLVEPAEDLSRNPSAASKSSYNSLQSEKHFSVGRVPTRLATQTQEQRNLSKKINAARRSAKVNSFVPPMAGPPPPIFTGMPSMPQAPSPVKYPSSVLNYNGSADNLSMDGATMQIQQMQHQIQQLQQLQQMQMMYQNPRNSQMLTSPPTSQPKSTDPVINAKIDEFVLLRELIASGNKSYEYRLKWVKMLISAVIYKLYAYINIKGDGIPPEQAAMNKLSFVKLSVTHLQKMLKDLDVDKQHTPQERRIFSEVCFIYGCLLMHDYMPRYEQDFNVQQDKDEADRFFRKCLELNPHNFKAHFKLAELFEQDQTEECFDTALYHYTQAAKLGYNRAIYQVALIYLTVPKVRLIKYFKYLRSLSEIDMTSKDIKLNPEDRDELEEVAGLACFQLAKIYEGIYPGDLTAEDEFVQHSLELAPVNYAKSLSFYNRSAKLQCLQAQVRLGHVYENGDLNRRQNAGKSIQWFIKASTSPLKFKRHPEAMLGISRWFTVGTNGQSKHIPYADPQRALMWCERAVKEFNFPEAYYVMGQFAEQGLADDAQAWYSEAYRLGYVEAGEKLQGAVYPGE